MVKSIAEYTAEISRGYDNSRNALQNQINAIEGNLAQTQKQINENYANQQNTLNKQSNQAAAAASMRAGGNGGSFGGAAEIANKKFYEQTFVPAQAQLQTNQSQALENAQSQANNNRLTLESQLASMTDEISRLGVQRYYDELERERQEKLARAQIAASRASAYNTYAPTSGSTSRGAQWGRGYNFGLADGDGYYFYDANGRQIKAGTYAKQTGENINSILKQMAQGGDRNAAYALTALAKGKKLLTGAEKTALSVLGL